MLAFYERHETNGKDKTVRKSRSPFWPASPNRGACKAEEKGSKVGTFAWPALLRKLDRIDPAFRFQRKTAGKLCS
jgi:hypothetical protein